MQLPLHRYLLGRKRRRLDVKEVEKKNKKKWKKWKEKWKRYNKMQETAATVGRR